MLSAFDIGDRPTAFGGSDEPSGESCWSLFDRSEATYAAPNQVDTGSEYGGGPAAAWAGAATYADGRFGRAFRVGDSNAKIMQVSAPLMAGRDVGTMAFRMKPRSINAFSNPVASVLDDGSRNWRFEPANPRETLVVFGVPGRIPMGWISSGTVLQTTLLNNAWSDIILTSDGSDVTAYNESGQTYTAPIDGSLPADMARWLFGAETLSGTDRCTCDLSEITFSHDHWSAGLAANFSAGPEPRPQGGCMPSIDKTDGVITFDPDSANWNAFNNGVVTHAAYVTRNGLVVAKLLAGQSYDTGGEPGIYRALVEASNNGGVDPGSLVATNTISLVGNAVPGLTSALSRTAGQSLSRHL